MSSSLRPPARWRTPPAAANAGEHAHQALWCPTSVAEDTNTILTTQGMLHRHYYHVLGSEELPRRVVAAVRWRMRVDEKSPATARKSRSAQPQTRWRWPRKASRTNTEGSPPKKMHPVCGGFTFRARVCTAKLESTSEWLEVAGGWEESGGGLASML
jgi:hypothetical protein